MKRRPDNHMSRLFTLLLLLGMIVLAPSTALGAKIYNETGYTVFVAFTPDQCGDSPLIPRIICAGQVALEPHASWSSNNRAGYVNAGGQTIHYNRNASGKGFSEIYFEYMECYVDRQGWIKIQAIGGDDRIQQFKMIAYDETGKESCTRTVNVVDLKI